MALHGRRALVCFRAEGLTFVGRPERESLTRSRPFPVAIPMVRCSRGERSYRPKLTRKSAADCSTKLNTRACNPRPRQQSAAEHMSNCDRVYSDPVSSRLNVGQFQEAARYGGTSSEEGFN